MGRTGVGSTTQNSLNCLHARSRHEESDFARRFSRCPLRRKRRGGTAPPARVENFSYFWRRVGSIPYFLLSPLSDGGKYGLRAHARSPESHARRRRWRSRFVARTLRVRSRSGSTTPRPARQASAPRAERELSFLP